MKHKCTIRRIGEHTAWISVGGDSSHQVIAVPLEIVARNTDPDGPRPGACIQVVLPSWVAEVANVL